MPCYHSWHSYHVGEKACLGGCCCRTVICCGLSKLCSTSTSVRIVPQAVHPGAFTQLAIKQQVCIIVTTALSSMQVSDREYQAGKATTADRLKTAEQMIRDGQGEHILFRDDDPVGTPVCASRFVSLASKHGDDDMFSSDFTDQELKVCNKQRSIDIAIPDGAKANVSSTHAVFALIDIYHHVSFDLAVRPRCGTFYLSACFSVDLLSDSLLQPLRCRSLHCEA